jgi:hypothetical protein
MTRTYRKRPVEIQAVQWTGDNDYEIAAFLNLASADYLYSDSNREQLTIHTLEGDHRASLGDYIIREYKASTTHASLISSR